MTILRTLPENARAAFRSEVALLLRDPALILPDPFDVDSTAPVLWRADLRCAQWAARHIAARQRGPHIHAWCLVRCAHSFARAIVRRAATRGTRSEPLHTETDR